MSDATLSHLSTDASPRLRVVFVIGTMGPGGAERQMIEILKRLDRTKFEPRLYLDKRIGELLPDVPNDVTITAFSDEPLKHNVLLRWLEFVQLTPIARMLHQIAFFRRTQPDVVYDRIFMATMLTAIPAWWCGIPRVSCAVVDPEPELMHWFRWTPRLGYRFARWAYATAARVVCNAGPLRQRMIDYFRLPEELVTVVPNVINLERITPRPAGETTKDVAELIIVGRLSPQKGQAVLLEALDDLIHVRGRQVRLTIIGRGPQAGELRSMVLMRELSEHVTFAGYLPNPTDLVSRADLFVLPSLYEGMPNALIEAVACGTPVIAADCPTGPREVLEDGRWGTLVPPGDAKALADAIESFLDDRAPFLARTEAARRSVLERYDASTGVRQLEQVLEAAAKQTA